MNATMLINWIIFFGIVGVALYIKRHKLKAMIKDKLAFRAQLSDIKNMAYKEEALNVAVEQGIAKARQTQEDKQQNINNAITQGIEQARGITTTPQDNTAIYQKVKASIPISNTPKSKQPKHTPKKPNKITKAIKKAAPSTVVAPAPKPPPEEFSHMKELMGVKK